MPAENPATFYHQAPKQTNWRRFCDALSRQIVPPALSCVSPPVLLVPDIGMDEVFERFLKHVLFIRTRERSEQMGKCETFVGTWWQFVETVSRSNELLDIAIVIIIGEHCYADLMRCTRMGRFMVRFTSEGHGAQMEAAIKVEPAGNGEDRRL